jgi:hypothetical protein
MSLNDPFTDDSGEAILQFHPTWVNLDPIALSMISAWGAWCRRKGKQIRVENIGRHADYAARMKLFEHLGVDYSSGVKEHEEAGRFLPIRQVKDRKQVPPIIGDISALLHLDDDPESLAAVQYCVSELLRNVLEHSNAPDGAFVCAHRFTKKAPHRVTIAVADCGQGIARHLGDSHPEALLNDSIALGLALRPGITGAKKGIYGTPDNAGAGLFITRCIAKGTGGYFLLLSDQAGYRLRRSNNDENMLRLFVDPYDEDKHDRWTFAHGWKGTAVTVEIRTDKIADYQGFFQWIFRQIPHRTSQSRRINFK